MNFDREKLRAFLLAIHDKKKKVQSLELLEKDFYLNFLLSTLNFDEYVFKGGTCLSKAYLDYFRLSEDLQDSSSSHIEESITCLEGKLEIIKNMKN